MSRGSPRPVNDIERHGEECVVNRPFPSSPQPSFQSEAKCEVFVMKISFHSY